MAKHWKKRRAMPLEQRRCAQIISTRWFRRQGPNLRKYFTEIYNGYNSERTDVMSSLSDIVTQRIEDIFAYVTDMMTGISNGCF